MKRPVNKSPKSPLKRIMQHPVIWLLLVTGAPLLLTPLACTKKADGITGDQGPQGPAGADGTLKASAITGYVNSYDQYGGADAAYAGFTVSTRNNGAPVTSTTDASGHFSLAKLPLGTYDILFAKTGYDSIKQRVVHSGGDEDKFIGIQKINQSVTTKITGLNSTLLANPFPQDPTQILLLTISFDGPALTTDKRRDFNFYFSRSSAAGVNNSDYTGSTMGTSLTSNTNSCTWSTSLYALGHFGYQSQDTIYVRTYVEPVASAAASWFDYTGYNTIPYPYSGDSSLTYFIWP